MITEYEFNQCDKSAQGYFIWLGKYICTRIDREHYIQLYQLEDFYVEVFYHLDYERVQKFYAFSNIEELNPYLEQLDLDAFI